MMFRSAGVSCPVDLDGIFINTSGASNGPAVVLVHGAPDRSATFRGVVARLVDSHVVVYYRRGYGGSAGAAPATSMDDHAADLLTILASLEAPLVVVAHSFGANPTMLAVECHALGASFSTTFCRHPLSSQRQVTSHVTVDMASELVTPFSLDEVVVPAIVGYGRIARSRRHQPIAYEHDGVGDIGEDPVTGFSVSITTRCVPLVLDGEAGLEVDHPTNTSAVSMYSLMTGDVFELHHR
jgi:pimeloyl-ACP methyl ester carboxylesterase